MKHIAALTLALGLSVSPATAQDGEVEEGFDLMEEGMRLLMRGLMSEMEPAISELRGTLEEMAPEMGAFLRDMGPAFAEFLAQVDDFQNYETPEFLPNGDIIIRRKPGAPLWMPEEENSEIEL
ncbi:AAA+ family ATPase [Yoonia sp. 2307UL14-13]|uniref:AAA+ family ATPase n=1 Tax=Yoonia sp. 2307UL14-13 TaxID=3126506 RepID=UPI00309D1029